MLRCYCTKKQWRVCVRAGMHPLMGILCVIFVTGSNSGFGEEIREYRMVVGWKPKPHKHIRCMTKQLYEIKFVQKVFGGTNHFAC